jgi:hypothetical protein
MDTGKAIFLGLALIALAIFATDVMRPAKAGLMSGGRYIGLASDNGGIVNIVDTETGAARLCVTGGADKGCRGWVK